MNSNDLAELELYVALGDSLSNDIAPLVNEPSHDPVAGGAAPGAASLLHRNPDRVWPEFAGRDLVTHNPRIRYLNLANDRAVTESVLRSQLKELPEDTGRPTLVTLTVGGNDVLGLQSLSQEEGRGALDRSIDQLREIALRLRLGFREARIVLSNVYDPSDSAAHLGDGIIMRRAWEWLRVFNAAVDEIARDLDCRLADLHGHFLGHGLSEPDPAKRWYLTRPLIEPNARGASEVRRVWLSVLEDG